MHANPAVIEIDNDTTPGMPRFAPPDDGLSTFLCARPGCLASPIGCWAVRRRPKTSCRTSGSGGRPLIEARSAIRWRSW